VPQVTNRFSSLLFRNWIRLWAALSAGLVWHLNSHARSVRRRSTYRSSNFAIARPAGIASLSGSFQHSENCCLSTSPNCSQVRTAAFQHVDSCTESAKFEPNGFPLHGSPDKAFAWLGTARTACSHELKDLVCLKATPADIQTCLSRIDWINARAIELAKSVEAAPLAQAEQ
jgi:hypothetical protein